MHNDYQNQPLSHEPFLVSMEGEESEIAFEPALEAILFAAGHAVSYEKIARLFGLSELVVKERTSNYAEHFNKFSQGIMMHCYDTSCQLSTREKFLPYIRAALGIRRNGALSNSSIESLSIIAYNQPVTRAYIDAVRGVDSTYAVSSLLERGLIETKGRLDAPGRPMLFGTSADFLRCFGLTSLSELPDISSSDFVEMKNRMQEQLEDDIDKQQVTLEFIEETTENTENAENASPFAESETESNVESIAETATEKLAETATIVETEMQA